jgi:hypothetical protein
MIFRITFVLSSRENWWVTMDGFAKAAIVHRPQASAGARMRVCETIVNQA